MILINSTEPKSPWKKMTGSSWKLRIRDNLYLVFSTRYGKSNITIHYGNSFHISKTYTVEVETVSPKSFAWFTAKDDDPLNIILLQCVWKSRGEFYSRLSDIPTTYWTDAVISQFGEITDEYISTGIELGHMPIQSAEGKICGWA